MSDENTRDEINGKTVFVNLNASRLKLPVSISRKVRDTFVDMYPTIRKLYAEAPLHSYILVCGGSQHESEYFNFSRFQYNEIIPLKRGDFADRIVGRHTQCHVRLALPLSISLRHLLIRLHLRPRTGEPVFKVLDLATPGGFFTAEGVPTFGLSGIGNGAFHLDGHSFFLLYREDSSLPEHPDQAWARIFSSGEMREDTLHPVLAPQENPFLPEQIKPRLAPVLVDDARSSGNTFFGRSSVWVIHGPEHLDSGSMVDRSPRFGVLEEDEEYDDAEDAVQDNAGLACRQGKRLLLLLQDKTRFIDVRIAVMAKQIQRGILIGRYERCNLGPTHFHFSYDVSRVHLLLLEDEGRYFAIDTASSCGTTCDGKPFTTMELTQTTRMVLADSLSVTWKFVDIE